MGQQRTRHRRRAEPVAVMSGPKNLFRGKNRIPISFAITDECRAFLDRQVKRIAKTGKISRSDFGQALIMLFGDKITREDIDRLSGRTKKAA